VTLSNYQRILGLQRQLDAAIYALDPKAMRQAVADGALPNHQHSSLTKSHLTNCVETGSASLLRALIELGADPNVQNSGHGGQSSTTLMEAAQANRLDMIDVLLAAGADPLACKANGSNALTMAAYGRASVPVLARLVEAGCLVNSAPGKETALMHAAERCEEAVFVFLLRAGADPSAQDIDGQTCLQRLERIAPERVSTYTKLIADGLREQLDQSTAPSQAPPRRPPTL
jgi:ankyrin repeat protein